MTVHIHPLGPSHLAAYKALMLHAYDAAADAFTSTSQERAAEPDTWWLQRMADRRGMSLVFGALDGDKLLGTVTLEFNAKPKTRHKAHLIGMFVLASARGQGLGRRLVEAALQAAADRAGTVLVTLTVTEGNEGAITLYESCGFVAFGTEPMAIATPQGYQCKVHMACQLASAR